MLDADTKRRIDTARDILVGKAPGPDSARIASMYRWVIVGGESGRKARPMKPAWVDGIKQQCNAAGVAFFFKQWGAWGADGERRSKSANGREYLGRVWDAMPRLA